MIYVFDVHVARYDLHKRCKVKCKMIDLSRVMTS